jgi:Ca2+-binding EF-hand superfamily protein
MPPAPTPKQIAQFNSIKEAFRLFDRDQKGMVDVREVGTILRYLGLCPSEHDLNELLVECEDEEAATGFVRFERFEKMAARELNESRFPRDSDDRLLSAFHVLDPEKKGYIEANKLRQLMQKHGEPFSQEEIEDFLSVAADKESGLLHYEDYIDLLAAQ